MRNFLKVNFLFICLLLAGCSSAINNTVDLRPQATVNANAIGNGKTVALQVIDERPQTLEAQYKAAKIDSSQNVTELVTNQVTHALTQYGFTPISDVGSSNDQLTVKILKINYLFAKSYVAANAETDVAVKVEAKNKTGTYTRVYRANSYSNQYLSVDSVDPSEQVNEAFNKVLNNLLNDQTLMQFLAK